MLSIKRYSWNFKSKKFEIYHDQFLILIVISINISISCSDRTILSTQNLKNIVSRLTTISNTKSLKYESVVWYLDVNFLLYIFLNQIFCYIIYEVK